MAFFIKAGMVVISSSFNRRHIQSIFQDNRPGDARTCRPTFVIIVETAYLIQHPMSTGEFPQMLYFQAIRANCINR
jgi:hypothetical protein